MHRRFKFMPQSRSKKQKRPNVIDRAPICLAPSNGTVEELHQNAEEPVVAAKSIQADQDAATQSAACASHSSSKWTVTGHSNSTASSSRLYENGTTCDQHACASGSSGGAATSSSDPLLGRDLACEDRFEVPWAHSLMWLTFTSQQIIRRGWDRNWDENNIVVLDNHNTRLNLFGKNAVYPGEANFPLTVCKTCRDTPTHGGLLLRDTPLQTSHAAGENNSPVPGFLGCTASGLWAGFCEDVRSSSIADTVSWVKNFTANVGAAFEEIFTDAVQEASDKLFGSPETGGLANSSVATHGLGLTIVTASSIASLPLLQYLDVVIDPTSAALLGLGCFTFVSASIGLCLVHVELADSTRTEYQLASQLVYIGLYGCVAAMPITALGLFMTGAKCLKILFYADCGVLVLLSGYFLKIVFEVTRENQNSFRFRCCRASTGLFFLTVTLGAIGLPHILP